MVTFSSLRLLLPAIIPSWRFFDAVTASPRVEYILLATPDDVSRDWREFRPRPTIVTFGTMLRRLLWNPVWNEDLFLVSLAERLVSETTAHTEAHSERELLMRVARHLDHCHGGDLGGWLQSRLRFVRRTGDADALDSQIAYISSPRAMAELKTP